jgi:serine O-acetyltransferase
VLIQTILADIKAPVDATRLSGAAYWTRVFGRVLVVPAAHVVILWRISTLLYRSPFTRPFAYLLRLFTSVWGGTEIHPAAEIGPGLVLLHSQKVMIGEGVKIGKYARISHGVSIGGDAGTTEFAGCPQIGDYVQIGMDSIIMGPVTIGDRAQIGAQSLVIKDVPELAIAVGSPARVLRVLSPDEHPAPRD